MIRSFGSNKTKRFAQGHRSPSFEAFRPAAERRLQALDAAPSLDVLAGIPGHRLEALKGDRRGQHSIRINDQWRVCFVWKDGDAFQVEIVDYH